MTSHQRVVVGVTAPLEVVLVDAEGDPAPAAGALSVSVVRSDGSGVLIGATATASTSGPDAPNPYRVVVPAPSNTLLDQLTATWVDAGDGSRHVTSVDVVGGVFVTTREVRRSDPTLLDELKYPREAIIQARHETESEFETECRRAFVPRMSVQVVRGSGTPELQLPLPHLRRIRRARFTDGSALGSVDVSRVMADVNGVARLPSTATTTRFGGLSGSIWPEGDIEITWEHGMDVVPDDVRRAALTRIRSRLNMAKSGIPDRAVSFQQGEGGTFAIATPGMRGSITGIPEVDVALNRWMWRRYQVTSVQC